MPSSDLRTIGVEHTIALKGFSCGFNWDNSLALFCYFVIQWCTSIHHLTGYFSTLYRLTRNLSTTQIYHLARDLEVSRKLSCVLLNLTNKTFSCNALFPSITVFFKAEQFLAKSLSLSFSWHPKDFLTMQSTLTFFTLCRNQTGLSCLGTTLVRVWTCTEEKGSLTIINRKIVLQPTWPFSDLSMWRSRKRKK